MDLVKSKGLSLKYKRFTPPGCKDIKIGKFELVAKTQFLCPEGPCIFFFSGGWAQHPLGHDNYRFHWVEERDWAPIAIPPPY